MHFCRCAPERKWWRIGVFFLPLCFRRVPSSHGSFKVVVFTPLRVPIPDTCLVQATSMSQHEVELKKRRAERERKAAERVARLKQAEAEKQARLKEKIARDNERTEARLAQKKQEASRKQALAQQRHEEAQRRRREDELRKATASGTLQNKLEAVADAALLPETQDEHAPGNLTAPPQTPPPTARATQPLQQIGSAQQCAEESTSYAITPERGDDGYDISSMHSDASTDDEDEPRHAVPAWAQGPAFKAAIYNQFLNDQDASTIFPAISPPDLSKIFPEGKKTRYFKRTSSALWQESPTKPGQLNQLC
eukprot:m.222064 g.222064  ORF g.222064 m.222064 type:complete len:308 (+) comp18731_c0_seq6:2063-2986(+)